MKKEKLVNFVIFVLVCFTPLQILIFNSSFGLTIFHFAIAVTSFFLILISDSKILKTIIKSKSMVVWLMLCLYHIINTLYFKIYDKDLITFKLILVSQLMTPYLCMCILAYSTFKNLFKTLKFFIFSLSINLVLTLIVVGSTTVLENRIGNSTFNANSIGHLTLILSCVICIYFSNKKSNYLTFCFYQIAPVIIVFLTASRASLLVVLFNFIAFFYLKSIKQNKVFIIPIIVFLAFSYLLFVGVNETYLIERLTISSDSSTKYDQYSTGTLFDFLGDRLIYYYLGWELFVQNSFTGIGIWSYRTSSGSNNVIHPEYLVHLVEGGIVAFSLFLLFYSQTILAINKMKIKFLVYKGILLQMLFAIFSLLLFFLVSRGIFNIYILSFLGIIHGFLIKLKHEYV